MKISEIETPALIIEKRALESNLDKMDKLMAESGMELWPHYKSTKCPEIAALQLKHGAKGLTCAKLSEAEDLFEHGIERIVIANQVVQKEKLPRLAALAAKADITVCADSAENLLQLEDAMAKKNAKVKIFIEYEVGMKRCGVESFEEFLSLAKLADSLPHLIFDGIQAYAGHISHEKDAAFRKSEVRRVEKLISELKAFTEGNGLKINNVCGGSTGFAADKSKDSVYTQAQYGSYLLMDASYEKLGLQFEKSLYLLATVISVKKDRFILDAGVKSITMDQYPAYVASYPDAELSFSEEHLAVMVPGCGLSLGDKVPIVPGHCCTIMNNHDKVYLVDGDEVEAIWHITARGKSV